MTEREHTTKEKSEVHGNKECNTPVLCYNPNLPPHMRKDSRDRRGFHISQSHLEGLWKWTFNSCENKKGQTPTVSGAQQKPENKTVQIQKGCTWQQVTRSPVYYVVQYGHASSPLTQPGVNLNKSEHNTAVSGVYSGLSMRLRSEKRKQLYWHHSFFNTLMLILGQIHRHRRECISVVLVSMWLFSTTYFKISNLEKKQKQKKQPQHKLK